MLNEYDVSKSVGINCEREMREICRYLSQHFGIIHFYYTKCFSDGTHFGLNTHNDWLKHFYIHYYEEHDVFHNTLDAYESGVILWSAIKKQESFIALRQHSNIDHGIALIEKHRDSCEIYNFATHYKNHRIINFYLNNLDILWRHTFYFKEKAADLIKKAEKDRWILPKCKLATPENKLFTNPAEINKALSDHRINRYYLSINNVKTYLTAAEARCCYYLIHTNSIKEVATLTHSSRRTVETHLNKVKDKLNCHSKSELINKISRGSRLGEIYLDKY